MMLLCVSMQLPQSSWQKNQNMTENFYFSLYILKHDENLIKFGKYGELSDLLTKGLTAPYACSITELKTSSNQNGLWWSFLYL